MVSSAVLQLVRRPTWIAPARLAPPGLRDGPVMLALLPDVHCASAVDAARQLAEARGRDLLVAHALELPDPAEVEALGPSTGALWERHQRETALRRLAACMDAHDLLGASTRIRTGPPCVALGSISAAERASAIVCGAGPRLGQSSVVGSTVLELARTAGRPVMAVPSAV